MSSDNIKDITLKKKDKAAFKILFDNCYPSLCLFANKYLNDKEISLDIVQDAFLYMWDKNYEFQSIDSAKSYLYKCVKNKSLNYLRDKDFRMRMDIAVLESEIFFRDNIIEEETYTIVYNAIRTLPPQGKRVIELSLDGLKNQEIAVQLNISINTVKTIKLRAFAYLRTELKDNIFIFYLLHCAKRKWYTF